MVIQLLGNLAGLLVRRRLEVAASSPTSANRAEFAWLLARGLMMTDAPRSLLMSLRAVRDGLAGGSPLVAGRALAFVGGGVFLQLPFFRRKSQRWLDQVHKWAQRHPILEVSARVWEGVASVSRGAWSGSRQTLEGVEEELRLHPDVSFERVVASVSRLVVLQHQGEYIRLLDGATREWENARAAGNDTNTVIFSVLAVDGYLAAGQFAPVDRILEQAEKSLPERFVPQTYDVTDALVHRDLARGHAEAALERFSAMQSPFKWAGGKMAAVTLFRNAKLGGRTGIAAGSPAVVRQAIRDLRGMKREDASAFAEWFECVLAGTAQERAQQIADGLDRAEAGSVALAVRLQVDDNGELTEKLRGRGVVDPHQWSHWMAPLKMPS